LYKPGVITGGKIYHECGTSRAIGYFLEPLIVLAPFGKQSFDLTLSGITNDNTDISVRVKNIIIYFIIILLIL
jgi:RNA 3'-terminal phosphate cyclase-like protein